LVLHIKIIPQRREEFLDILKGTMVKDLEGKLGLANICIFLIKYSDLMVIAENNTRWNSTYLFIARGLKLKAKLQYYFINNKKELSADYLEKTDWKAF